MCMNVPPIPRVSERINEIRKLTATIVNREILPYENMLWAWHDGRFNDAEIEEGHRRREDIKSRVKDAGLWAPHLPLEYGAQVSTSSSIHT